MPLRPDVILIGSGPAAVAALAVAPPGLRITVITGAAPDATGPAPPKIRAVAYERREPAGLADWSPFGGAAARQGLSSTAAEGGLAAYWGQQFVRYGEGDPWPAQDFADYGTYLAACDEVEALFRLSPAQAEARPVGDGYQAQTPRLLIGTPQDPANQLLAMRSAFRALAEARGAVVLPRRAVRLDVDPRGVGVLLDDGGRIEAERVLLAAGVIGDLSLAMRSWSEIVEAGFRDHMPYMLYTRGLERIAPVLRSDGLDHFNSLSLERVEAGQTRLFTSIYRMSRATMSLLLTALGLPPALRGWPAPPMADLVKPMQLWTDRTFVSFRMLGDGRIGVATPAPELDGDPDAAAFVDWLKSHRVWLSLRPSNPGDGFHYHAGVVSTGAGSEPLGRYLDRRSGGRAVCIDASVLPEIGCRPHSLTAMTVTQARVRRAWAGA